jgi:hypothetical protein
MTIDEAIQEWQSKNRRMGCVAATDWFCKRVKDFYPDRLPRYTSEGHYFEHVVATNGFIRIDLSPYADRPREEKIKLERKEFWDRMLSQN